MKLIHCDYLARRHLILAVKQTFTQGQSRFIDLDDRLSPSCRLPNSAG